MSAPKDISALAGIFAVSGVVHLVRPETYEPIMPDFVPAHREVIYASGVRSCCAPSDCRTPARAAWPATRARRCCSASTRPTSRWQATRCRVTTGASRQRRWRACRCSCRWSEPRGGPHAPAA